MEVSTPCSLGESGPCAMVSGCFAVMGSLTGSQSHSGLRYNTYGENVALAKTPET